MASFEADFDSGSCHSFFSLQELENNKWFKIDIYLDFPHVAEYRGEEYLYYIKNMYVRIEDENKKSNSAKMHCFAVQNWRFSPFCALNPNRTALVGRDILRKFPLRIVLDSGKRTTTVFYNEECLNAKS
jgi:hypothetical protein